MVQAAVHQRVVANGSGGLLSPVHDAPTRHVTHNGRRAAAATQASSSNESSSRPGVGDDDFLSYHRPINKGDAGEEARKEDQTWCSHCKRSIRWMNWPSHENSNGHQLAVGLSEKAKQRGQHSGKTIDYGVFRSQSVKQDLPQVIGLHNLLQDVKSEEDAKEAERQAAIQLREQRLKERRELMQLKMAKWRVNAGVKKLKSGTKMAALARSATQIRKQRLSMIKLDQLEEKHDQKKKTGGGTMPAIFGMLPKVMNQKATQDGKAMNSTWNNFGAGHAAISRSPVEKKTTNKKTNKKKNKEKGTKRTKAATVSSFSSPFGKVGNAGPTIKIYHASPPGRTSPRPRIAGAGGTGCLSLFARNQAQEKIRNRLYGGGKSNAARSPAKSPPHLTPQQKAAQESQQRRAVHHQQSGFYSTWERR